MSDRKRWHVEPVPDRGIFRIVSGDDFVIADRMSEDDASLVVAAIQALQECEQTYTSLLISTRKRNAIDEFASEWSRFVMNWMRGVRQILGKPLNP